MTTKNGFTCIICGKAFDVKRYLVKHEKRMHSDTSIKKEPVVDLKCSMCGKAFPRLSHLQRHQLTHLNIREFQCPFCNMQFVQKPHLIRHVSRFHASEQASTMSNIMSTARKNKLKDPNITKNSCEASTSSDTSAFCGSLVKYFLCFRCGQLFDNRFDLTRHLKNTHKPLVCHHCNLIFYGNESLKLHELKTRSGFYSCHCGASFNKKDTFDRHKDACSGKGTFICMECGQVFVQRIQFDRHYKKEHFLDCRCRLCDWVADSPVIMNKHMKEDHLLTACGFCGKLDPERNHIFTYHWKRVKKPISLSKKVRVPVVGKKNLKLTEEEKGDIAGEEASECLYDSDADVKPSIFHDESSGEEKIFLNEGQYEFIMRNAHLASKSTSQFPKSGLDVDLKDHMESFTDTDIFEKASTNTLQSEVVLNVVVSVPDMADEINLADRLPPDLLEAFPDLRSAVILIDHSYPQQRFLNLNIPLLPPASDAIDITKWLNVPIHI